MNRLSELSYEIEHDIVALSKMIIELRDKHGDKLVHAHGGME